MYYCPRGALSSGGGDDLGQVDVFLLLKTGTEGTPEGPGTQ